MGRDWFRDDPIADAEDNSTDSRPILGYCEVCGREIHGGTSTHDPDEAYDIEGAYVCYDHLHEYFEDCKLK